MAPHGDAWFLVLVETIVDLLGFAEEVWP